MTKLQFIQFANRVMSLIRKFAPKDTGNLAYNAIQMHYVNENKIIIEVNQSEAPYMVYTNEPWISDRWKGKKNPNEKWWEKAIERAVQIASAEIGGKTIES